MLDEFDEFDEKEAVVRVLEAVVRGLEAITRVQALLHGSVYAPWKNCF